MCKLIELIRQSAESDNQMRVMCLTIAASSNVKNHKKSVDALADDAKKYTRRCMRKMRVYNWMARKFGIDTVMATYNR